MDWHLACINNRWTKRALVSAGFGYVSPPHQNQQEQHAGFARWKPIFSVAEIGGQDSAAAAADVLEQKRAMQASRMQDIENGLRESKTIDDESSTPSPADSPIPKDKAGRSNAAKIAVVQGLNRPLFHVDLTNALQSAIANVEQR